MLALIFSLSAYTDALIWGGKQHFFSRAQRAREHVAGDPTTALGIATKQYLDGKIPVDGWYS